MEQIVEIGEQFSTFFNRLNEGMTGCSFDTNAAVVAAGDTTGELSLQMPLHYISNDTLIDTGRVRPTILSYLEPDDMCFYVQ